MGYFYFDESIHKDGGFITGCMVYSRYDLNPEVTNAIIKCGLDPEHDEHKSGNRINGNIRLINLREELFSIARKVKIGLAFVPTNERNSLFYYGMKLFQK